MKSVSPAYAEVVLSRSKKVAPPKSLFQEHFATILNVAVAAATSISGYFLVTAHRLNAEARQLDSQLRRTDAEIRKLAHETLLHGANTQQVVAKTLSEARAADASNAAKVKMWIAGLTSGKKSDVSAAATALALGGKNNFPLLAAGLLYPNQMADREVKVGIIMAALIDQAAMCDALQRALEITDRGSLVAIAQATNAIGCISAIPVLERVVHLHGRSAANSELEALKMRRQSTSNLPPGPGQ